MEWGYNSGKNLVSPNGLIVTLNFRGADFLNVFLINGGHFWDIIVRFCVNGYKSLNQIIRFSGE
jgi:hypothetical protein